VLQSHGHNQVPNQGQNFVNTQNTVIQNPNVVNVNVAHVLCSNPQFQGQQQGQSIQGTLIQTADGKHIIIPSSQLPSSNQIQIQNLPQMAIQPQINVVPTSSSTGTTPLVQVLGVIVFAVLLDSIEVKFDSFEEFVAVVSGAS
jgi:endoglucanase Acf2